MKTSQIIADFCFDCVRLSPQRKCIDNSVPQPDKNKSSNGILKIYPSGGFIHTLILTLVQQTRRQRNAFSWLLICSSHTMKMKRFRRTVYQHYTTAISYNGHYCNDLDCLVKLQDVIFGSIFLNQQSVN